MISYNTFVRGISNGLQHKGNNSVLLLQNENGDEWGAGKVESIEELGSTKVACQKQINQLWIQLVAELPVLEKVIFYVGAEGSEKTIELAAQNGLAPERAVFVLCDCGIDIKLHIIRSFGFSDSQIIMCECGGHDTMFQIYHSVLEQGRI
jgi:hypothetical protein